MKRVTTALLAGALLSTSSLPIMAEEQPRFALRFGGVLIDPTAEETIRGENTEFDIGAGGELNFEWYFKPDWGLDVSSTGAIDVEDVSGDQAIGMSINPLYRRPELSPCPHAYRRLVSGSGDGSCVV